MMKLPGIFNDVIGPVMRGPSSSHTAASWRIARMAIQILNEPLKRALIEFDRQGAWAPNYREQGTTIGMDGGLLALDITDARMKDTAGYAREKNVDIEYMVSSFPTQHANTVRLTLWGHQKKKVQLLAVSLGGGSFEIRSVNGFDTKIRGDLFEMIIFTDKETDRSGKLRSLLPAGVKSLSQKGKNHNMVQCAASLPFSNAFINSLRENLQIEEIAMLDPIMPIVSGRENKMPFSSIASAIDYAHKTASDLGDLGLLYEKCISGLSDEALVQKMKDLIRIIHQGIAIGIRGTTYKDRILQQQSHFIGKAEQEGKIKKSVVNRIIENVSALMEAKSAMEVVVAVPTAGSCGTVGGALRGLSGDLASSERDLVKAYFAAGLVGAYFAQGPGFSAEEHGCQVECGAASGMAAAGLVQLMGGTAEQALGAASMAIQNMIGLVCDPVADRVEVPCLGKNISAAVNAHSSAVMAISGFDPVLPLAEVIQTVSRVSRTMPNCVKCTGKGGLAITDTAARIKKEMG